MRTRTAASAGLRADRLIDKAAIDQIHGTPTGSLAGPRLTRVSAPGIDARLLELLQQASNLQLFHFH